MVLHPPPPQIKSLQFIVEFRYINFGEQHYSVILMWLHDGTYTTDVVE